MRRTISEGSAAPSLESQEGLDSAKVSQMWRMMPGPGMSASVKVSPGLTQRLSALDQASGEAEETRAEVAPGEMRVRLSRF
jgi:hypothetical protein